MIGQGIIVVALGQSRDGLSIVQERIAAFLKLRTQTVESKVVKVSQLSYASRLLVLTLMTLRRTCRSLEYARLRSTAVSPRSFLWCRRRQFIAQRSSRQLMARNVSIQLPLVCMRILVVHGSSVNCGLPVVVAMLCMCKCSLGLGRLLLPHGCSASEENGGRD